MTPVTGERIESMEVTPPCLTTLLRLGIMVKGFMTEKRYGDTVK